MITLKMSDLLRRMAIFLVVAFNIQIPYLTANYVSAFSLYQYGQLCLLVFLTVLQLPRIIKKGVSKVTGLIILYIIWYVISAYVNNVSLLTVRYFAIRILLFISLVSFFKRRYCKDLLSSICIYLLLITIVNTLTAFIFPNALYANNTGRLVCFFLGEDNASISIYLLTIGACAILAYIKNNKYDGMFIISIANALVFTLYRNISGGFFCLFLMGVLLVVYLLVRMKIKMSHILIAMLVFLVAFVILQRISMFQLIIEQFLHRDITMSKRTVLWEQALKLFQEKPIFGYGSYYSEELMRVLNSSARTAITPHNSYVAILLCGGAVLLLIFAIMLVITQKAFDGYKSESAWKGVIVIAMLGLLLHAQIEGSDVEYIMMLVYLVYSVFGKEAIQNDNPRIGGRLI